MAYEININISSALQSVQELKKEIDALKSSLSSLDKETEQYAKVSKQLADAEKQLSTSTKATTTGLKEVVSTAKQAGDSVKKSGDETKKATDNFKIMRDEIKQLKSDFAGTVQGTQEYDDALLALSNKMRDFNDMNKMIRSSAADTGQILANVTGTVKGVAGGFEAAAGVFELFGVSTDKLQVAEKRTMGFIKVVQGLQAAEDGLAKKLPMLRGQWNALTQQIFKSTATKKAATVATQAQTTADTAAAGASSAVAKAEAGQATANTAVATTSGVATAGTFTLAGAFKALTAAIAANPFGAILVALTALLPLLKEAGKWIGSLFSSGSDNAVVSELDELNKKLEDLKTKAKIELEIKKIEAGEQGAVAEAEMELEHYQALLDAIDVLVDKEENKIFAKMATASKKQRKQYQEDLKEFKDNAAQLKREYQKIVDDLTTESELGLPQAKDQVAAEKEENKRNEERNRAAAAAYKSRKEELEKYVEELRKASLTESELENEKYEKELNDLKEARKKKVITQEQYDKYEEQLRKTHNKNLEKIEEDRKKKEEDRVREAEELSKKLANEFKSPLELENERYDEELKKLKENQEKELISIEQFNKDKENAEKKHQRNLGKISLQETTVKESNINKDFSSKSATLSFDYDMLSSFETSDIKQMDIAMEKEQSLFDLKKKHIEERITLYQNELTKQQEGSEEYIKTQEKIADLEEEKTKAEQEHALAVIELEQQRKEAVENTAKAYIDAVNSVIDQISGLIGMYAEEAKARADNEKLSLEARKKALEESKNAQIAQIIISTLQGIVGAWAAANQPPIAPYGTIAYGTVMSALLTTTAAMNIAKIKSQTLNGGGSVSGSAASVSVPTYDGPSDMITVSRPTEQADTRVYVLEEDITTTQDKNKVRVEESTF